MWPIDLRQWAAPHAAESSYSLVEHAVVGATYPGQLAELRTELPGILLLVPGCTARRVPHLRDVAAAFEEKDGLDTPLINNSPRRNHRRTL